MIDVDRCIFLGMQLLLDKKWVTDQALVIEGKFIKAIIPANMIKHHLPAKHHEFPTDYFLMPGLIDLHVHGIAGHDVMDANLTALRAMSASLAAVGVTGFLATTMTAEVEQIEKVLSLMPDAMQDKSGAAILGVHLEGPFIAKNKAGAQRAAAVRLPDIDLIRRWQKLSQAAIKLVTLAPELPEALAFIKLLHDEMRVLVGVGHTNATYAETVDAILAGSTYATHLFNAMRGMHQREPGALGALLLSDEVTAELIVDGLHLHPAMVELALKIKGKERLLLVTDAMRATCLGDGQYELGGQTVQVYDGKAVLPDGTLAGSTLRLPEALRNMVQYTPCTLPDAIAMATENPARLLGLLTRKGTIAVGKEADLVVMNAGMQAVLTMREGKVVFNQ